jgi:hypothetical protein
MDRTLDVSHASLTSDAPLGRWAVLGVARYRHEANDPDIGTVVAGKHE